MAFPSPPLPPLPTRVDASVLADSAVLVRGNRRTERVLIGQMLHARSSRSQHPFCVVACDTAQAARSPAVDPPQTNDLRAALGNAASCGQGTLFIDRVDCLTLPDQVQLLHTLQDPSLDAQVVAGTQSDLARLVEEGRFLPLLHARLASVELVVPPGEPTAPSPCSAPNEETGSAPDWSLSRAVKRAERTHLVHALRHHQGNRTRTAHGLGISRKNLWEKMKAHAILPHEYASPQPN